MGPADPLPRKETLLTNRQLSFLGGFTLLFCSFVGLTLWTHNDVWILVFFIMSVILAIFI